MKSITNQLMFGKVNSILNDKFDIFLERLFQGYEFDFKNSQFGCKMRNFASPSNDNIHNLEVLENGNPKKKLIWHFMGNHRVYYREENGASSQFWVMVNWKLL